MNACNGITEPIVDEAVEITRLEPVIIEVEEDGRVFSHLILFEFICNIDFTQTEVIVDGEIQETVFEPDKREIDG